MNALVRRVSGEEGEENEGEREGVQNSQVFQAQKLQVGFQFRNARIGDRVRGCWVEKAGELSHPSKGHEVWPAKGILIGITV